MRAAILLNGEPYGGRISADKVYCCDGAYDWAAGRVAIDENIGDFDSVKGTPYPPPDKIYPAEKDFTDGEIALARAIADGADEIIIYGGFGGRSDHFAGNLHLLFRAEAAGVSAAMVSEKEIALVKSGLIQLNGFRGRTLSVLPFGGKLHIIESAGLKYPYPENLVYGECRGVSNVAVADEAFIRTEGTALVIINRGEV